MKPLLLEVISVVPSLYGLCPSCEFFSDEADLKAQRDKEDLNAYPEHVKEEYLFLSGWIRELVQKYGQQILIKLIDAQSLQGFYKSARFFIRKYPAFIVNHNGKYSGRDKAELDALIRRHLDAADAH